MPDASSPFGAESSTREDAVQFEFFPLHHGEAHAPLGVRREIARASVSPGWWPIIETIYRWSAADVAVVHCREVDGVLELELTSEVDPDTLAPIIKRIRDAVARTCGCCGDGGARPYRPSLDVPTRVVCERCRERLRAGEAYLAVADDYFCLDGSRRRPSSAVVVASPTTAPSIDLDVKRICAALPADELRRVIVEIRDRMAAEVVGHDGAVARLALLGALHVGGGLARGGRALIIGPSGSGKSTLIAALRHALEPWALPWILASAGDLSSPGWAGLTVGGLIDAALADIDPSSERAHRAVVVIDEIHHARIIPGTYGNTTVKRQEVLSSLLDLTGYGAVHLGDSPREWSSQRALVLCVGAFTDVLNWREPITIEALVRAGLPLELCTRIAQEILVLEPLTESRLVELLHRWPALLDLSDVCARLGYPVHILKESYARAARVIALGHDRSTPRTAGAWLVSALRRALLVALADPSIEELVISPDSLPIPRTAAQPRPRDDPPDGGNGWDATIILTPR